MSDKIYTYESRHDGNYQQYGSDLDCTTILKEHTKKVDFRLNQARIPVSMNTNCPRQVISCIVEHIECWKALDTAACHKECHMPLVVSVDGVCSVATLESACKHAWPATAV